MNNNLLNKSSGRINLKEENGTPIFFQDMILNNDKSNYSNALKYTLEDSDISKRYFSKENIDIIQNTIKNKVHEKTKYKFKVNNQTPWQEIFRNTVSQLDDGACINLIEKYIDVSNTKGIPRDSH